MNRLVRTALLTLVLLSARTIEAADADSVIQERPKSPGTAAAYSAIGTLAPVTIGSALLMVSQSGDINEYLGWTSGIIVGTGVLLGPGIGHLYAGNPSQFAIGTGVRIIGATLVAVCLMNTAWNWYGSGDSVYGSVGASMAGLCIGGTLLLYSMVYDITTADNSAHNYNARHNGTSLSVFPTWFPDNGAAGIRLIASF
jgi:hypothetical protein